MHDNRLVTIFSASSYCGTNNNHGAYAIFQVCRKLAFLISQHGADIRTPKFVKYHADVDVNLGRMLAFVMQ